MLKLISKKNILKKNPFDENGIASILSLEEEIKDFKNENKIKTLMEYYAVF